MNAGMFGGGTTPSVTPEDALARQQAGALIVDVREPHEWHDGHIPDAVLIPLGRLGARLGELDPSQEIIAVCHTGVRSQSAVQALRRVGFSNVWNLVGGMVAWERKQLPVTR
jgi:rhodanese-related sulfurtransferase